MQMPVSLSVGGDPSHILAKRSAYGSQCNAKHGLHGLLRQRAGIVRHERGGRCRFTLSHILKSLNQPGNLYIASPLPIRHINQMAKTSKAVKKKRTPSAAFMKPVQPDEKLALVVGEKPLPRTELTKKLWAYIRKNGLQDKKVRTQINADENLKAVFNGKKSVSMFEMTKLVSGHVKK
jgi:hypothetical protein